MTISKMTDTADAIRQVAAERRAEKEKSNRQDVESKAPLAFIQVISLGDYFFDVHRALSSTGASETLVANSPTFIVNCWNEGDTAEACACMINNKKSQTK